MEKFPARYSAGGTSSRITSAFSYNTPTNPDGVPGTPTSFTVAAAHNPLITLNPALPFSYPIGKQKHVRSLVDPLDLRDHLVLLRYFHQLRENVISQPVSDGGLSGDAAWAIFLAKAVHRFEVWVRTVANNTPQNASSSHPASWEEYEIPPLDVIMVWHTYLLNPRIYYEDGLRFNRAFLLHRHVFPLHHIATTISDLPTSTRISHFQSRTLERFHQPVKPQLDGETPLNCPGCNNVIEVRWYESDGSGYSQDGFTKRCSFCPVNLTRETLGLAKLARDLRRIKANPNKKSLAGLLLEPHTGGPDPNFSKEWNGHLVSTLPVASGINVQFLGWNFTTAAKLLKPGFLETDENSPVYKAGMKRIMKSYNSWTSFSIDLRAAIKRQFRFIGKIASLGWLQPRPFGEEVKGDGGDGESRTLRRFVTQYHAFLDLMATNPGAFLVPTLGIDLAWHTHQLFHNDYRESTTSLLGTLVDHDDAVEEKNLASSYNRTAQLWQSRYQIPYSVCGCPQPPPPISLATIIRSTVMSKLPLARRRSKAPVNARPDLLDLVQTSLDESHPSEHPLLAVRNKPAFVARQRVRVPPSKNTSFGNRMKKAIAGPAIDTQIDADEKLRSKREKHRSESAAFYFGLMMEGADEVVSYRALGQADCMVGMGGSGACQGGNIKHRAPIQHLQPQNTVPTV